MNRRQNKRRSERRRAHEAKTGNATRAFGKAKLGTGVAAGAALAFAAPASAQDFTVTTLSDSGPGSLRAAIDDANGAPGADRILFQSGLSGSITLQSGLNVSDALEIEGPGTDVITIDGDDSFSLLAVEVPQGTTNFGISGLTMTDGGDSFGGAIDALNSNVTVSDSDFSSNSGQIGGAIYTGGSGEGGVAGTLDVARSTFSGNTSGSGGAIATYGVATVDSSTFNNNRALQGGGAIEIASSNTAGGLEVTQSTFNRNSSAFAGGAIAMIPCGCQIDIDLSVSSSTISGNVAGLIGGGISGGFTSAAINNSVIENNFAYYGPDLYSGLFDGPPPNQSEDPCGCYPVTDFATSFSFIGTTSGADISEPVANSNILNGGDALLGRLAENGGPTKTMAIDSTSPVVNKGSSPLTVDQRGETRPVEYPDIPNSPAVGANGSDMGAYELQYTPPEPPVVYRPFIILGSTPNRTKGTATVRVKIPAPGSVRLVGNKIIKSSERHFDSKGVYKFQAVPLGKNIKNRLNKKGRARVLVKFRYTPDQGRVLAKGKLVALFKGKKTKKAKQAALREWRSAGGLGDR